jgi:hypothetical protein
MLKAQNDGQPNKKTTGEFHSPVAFFFCAFASLRETIFPVSKLLSLRFSAFAGNNFYKS